MSGANKILTVSYGTFSCTIEGFEDPFGTMKQIAEYFRDLAAEDRYFGAEPPVPDAEALRHLAEREAARRVEARMGVNGVHLRQLDDSTAAEAATPVSQVAPRMAAAAAASFSADVLSPSEVIDPEPESVAARLSRIRAVVARARSTAVWPDEVPDVEIEVAQVADDLEAASARAGSLPPDLMPSEVLASDLVKTASGPAAADPVLFADTEIAASPTADHADPWFAADLPEPEFVAEAEVETYLPADTPADVSGVASAQEALADETGPAAEEEPSFALEPDDAGQPRGAGPDSDMLRYTEAVGEVLSDAVAEPGHPSSERSASEVVASPAEESLAADFPFNDDTGADREIAELHSYSSDMPAARLVALRKSDYAAAEATERLEDVLSRRITPEDVHADAGDLSQDDLEEQAYTSTGAKDDWNASLLAAIRAVNDADKEPAEDAADLDETTYTGAPVEVGETTEWNLEPAEEDEAVDYAALAAAPLRLDQALRVEVDLPEVPGAIAAVANPAPPDAHEPEVPAADLRDQFDLLDGSDATPLLLSNDPFAEDMGAETAGVHADAVDDRDAAVSPQRVGHDMAVEDLERVPEEASVDRLLAETNSQLESTEMNRRRSAIAHLKAAVAAARADKSAPEGGTRPDEGGMGSAFDKFREDLARVVRPRRPVDDGQPRAVRRMPPLMLVSEQRVDGADAPARSVDAIAGTVRPRRITTREVSSDEGEEGSSGGFADFAESMGARDLPDMLEAAAAYTAFVEGRPSFSRPQLMQMMRVAEGLDDEFSREEQLRSFGLLLRQGRIQKLKRGQFTVADDTRFRPEHRHAGE